MSEVKEPAPKKNQSNKNRIIMFAIISAGLLICALVFSLLGLQMNKNSNRTIDDVGETYMKSMGYQITHRFESVMEQRLSMVESIIEDDTLDEDDELINSAKLHGFEFLAFYSVEDVNDPKNGSTIDMLYGKELRITDHKSFMLSAHNGEKKLAVGKGITESGEPDDGVVFISVPTDKYTMSHGGKSTSLLAGVTNTVFVNMLDIADSPDDADATYSFIIRKDTDAASGKRNSFVMRNPNNYFSELLHNAFEGSEIDVENLLDELNEKMQKNEVYSNILHVNGHHVHMYCNRLEMSEWYMVTMIDNVHLDQVIETLSDQWTKMIVMAIVTIAVILVVIFVIYLYLNDKNVKKLKKAREEALQASKAKSEFLSNMSHDIRTPMNAIVGMTAIARANADDQQQVSDCLKKIALSSKHLLGLINDVLDMSKIESGKMTLNMEQVSLREVLDGITTIIQPQISAKHQSFNAIIHNVEHESVLCDSVRLNQVLLNLLSNAIKFTADEGTIELYLDQEESPLGKDHVRTHIRVKDNGIGMSPEFQKRIFESFTREDNRRVHHTEGTGLGMTITKYIVDQMNGTIELQSEQGKGTEFHITLDLEKALVAEEDMVLPDWKMLIVDDDKELCETAVDSLKEIGIRGEWALDGEEAISKIVKARDEKQGYDVILLDWKLPGIDGIETAKRIKNSLNHNDIPILLISAYDWGEIEEDAHSAGICGFIGKPLFKSTLFYGLKKFVTGDASEDERIAAERLDLAGTHILLAEDNDLNAEIAETMLESVGITCDRAENGRECVDMLTASAPGTYKAILMDIRMPIMTGYEATEAIRKLDHADKDLPIIAMTADAFADDVKKCLDCGMNAHIAKPIDVDTVQHTLSKFINK